MFTHYLTKSGIGREMMGYCFRLATVAEMMTRLPGRSCNLAIVSACESGVPRLHGAGEMTGIPAALLVAGARSVIASMWRVHDAATTVLMDNFYKVWQGGSGSEPSAARALSRAREALRTSARAEIHDIVGKDIKIPDGEHPFAGPIFTDAFVCVGAF